MVDAGQREMREGGVGKRSCSRGSAEGEFGARVLGVRKAKGKNGEKAGTGVRRMLVGAD